jgi:hypothetical protein
VKSVRALRVLEDSALGTVLGFGGAAVLGAPAAGVTGIIGGTGGTGGEEPEGVELARADVSEPARPASCARSRRGPVNARSSAQRRHYIHRLRVFNFFPALE